MRIDKRLTNSFCVTSDYGHLFEVQSELIETAANWRSIGVALHLKPEFLQNTEKRYGSDPRACLTWILMEWLMRKYDVEKFGEPTWQRLVEAVGHPAGGTNMALAREIARRHNTEGMTFCGSAFIICEQILLSCTALPVIL